MIKTEEEKAKAKELIKEILSSDNIKKEFIMKLSDDLFKLATSKDPIDDEFIYQLKCCGMAMGFIIENIDI